MHHTSGIPFQSIALIQPDTTKDALKKTVDQLKSISLMVSQAVPLNMRPSTMMSLVSSLKM